VIEWRGEDPQALECNACGRKYSRGDGRYCSPRCRTAADNGWPPYKEAPDKEHFKYSLPIMGDGFAIKCAGCHDVFASKGLRCCSPDCERKYRAHEENAATLAEVGLEPSTRRKCECGAPIPRYQGVGKARRATRKDARFCTEKCEKKAGRQGSGLTPLLSAI
jgi:hypothetical protein